MRHLRSTLLKAPRSKGLKVAGAAFTLAACLAAGLVQAADQGPRHHAQGQYDAVTATYVVVEGDDLVAIGERFEIPVDALKAQNKLSSDTIKVGDKLVIAAAGPAGDAGDAGAPPSLVTPNKVETRIGTLEFDDGRPNAATLEKVYDHLDFSHAVRAFTDTMQGVSIEAIRQGFYAFGAKDNEVVVWSDLLGAETLMLTANADTVYVMAFLDLSDGPMVLEVPPKVLGAGSQSYPSPAAEPNADGSTTIYFGPTQPEGVKRGNWIQTDPEKGWWTILRLYSPLEPFFTKTWRPSEIELVN